AVSMPGDFAVRGGIVDVFGLDRARPWRAEWFGDEVDDLRVFDVDTQESVAKLEQVAVWPARELDLRPDAVQHALDLTAQFDLATLRDDVREVWERDRGHLAESAYDEGVDLFFPYLMGDTPATLLDHLQDPIVLFSGGAPRLRRVAQRYLEEIDNLRAQEEARGELPVGSRSGLVSAEM